jgi:hypothetical protein
MRLRNIFQETGKALKIANALIDAHDLSINETCMVLIEKGLAYRYSGDLSGSTDCFDKAKKLKASDPLWHCIACFEMGINMSLSRKDEDAFNVAFSGHLDKLNGKFFSYNPCSILYQYLGQKFKIKTTSSIFLDRWESSAYHWPRPFFPYQVWIRTLKDITQSGDIDSVKANIAISNIAFHLSSCYNTDLFH